MDQSVNSEQKQGVRGIDDLAATLDVGSSDLDAVEMEPGDVVLWHPYTIHGSPPNKSDSKSRKFYVVGYMAASCCDTGAPV